MADRLPGKVRGRGPGEARGMSGRDWDKAKRDSQWAARRSERRLEKAAIPRAKRKPRYIGEPPGDEEDLADLYRRGPM